MERKQQDYTDITIDVVEAYGKLHSIRKVSQRLHLGTRTVTDILREAGIDVATRGGKQYNPGSPTDKKACYYCRAFSRTSHTDGFCLTHRRTTMSNSVEPCFRL